MNISAFAFTESMSPVYGTSSSNNFSNVNEDPDQFFADYVPAPQSQPTNQFNLSKTALLPGRNGSSTPDHEFQAALA